MGSGCEVSLDGLNSRIEWERVGPLELLLYVPNSMNAGRRARLGKMHLDPYFRAPNSRHQLTQIANSMNSPYEP
jgi:hypothetical protein